MDKHILTHLFRWCCETYQEEVSWCTMDRPNWRTDMSAAQQLYKPTKLLECSKYSLLLIFYWMSEDSTLCTCWTWSELCGQVWPWTFTTLDLLAVRNARLFERWWQRLISKKGLAGTSLPFTAFHRYSCLWIRQHHLLLSGDSCHRHKDTETAGDH